MTLGAYNVICEDGIDTPVRVRCAFVNVLEIRSANQSMRFPLMPTQDDSHNGSEVMQVMFSLTSKSSSRLCSSYSLLLI